LNPVDIHDLRRLLDKTKKAELSIKNKNIILFIGDTGAGKTTTILGLYGLKMVKKLFKGMDWITTS
jgi:flagellar biosynthesis GTPase FlhF